MKYRSVQDLSTSIAKNLHKIPTNIDLIVGIPRSGLLAANLLALHAQLPLADLEGFKAGRLLSAGSRMSKVGRRYEDLRHVLVLDDSVYEGTAMRKAKASLAGGVEGKTIYYAAVYVRPASEKFVDIWFDIQLFEWNMMHHAGALAHGCMEIDGVLCGLPSPEDLKSEQAYLRGCLKSRKNACY